VRRYQNPGQDGGHTVLVETVPCRVLLGDEQSMFDGRDFQRGGETQGQVGTAHAVDSMKL
jgi:hypothetical protein